MLDNTFTLNVNHDNDDGTTATLEKVFERYDDDHPNRSIYVTDGHTPASRDQIAFYRTPEKPNGNFPGQRKAAFKVTKDTTVLGLDGLAQLKSPAIVDIGTSFPVGLSEADQLEMMMTAIALLSNIDLIKKVYFQSMK